MPIFFFFLTNSSPRVYTPGPGASPPPSPSHLRRSLKSPKTDKFMPNVGENNPHRNQNQLGSLCTRDLSIFGVRGQQNKGIIYKNTYSPTPISQSVCLLRVCALLYPDISLNSRSSPETILFQSHVSSGSDRTTRLLYISPSRLFFLTGSTG